VKTINTKIKSLAAGKMGHGTREVGDWWRQRFDMDLWRRSVTAAFPTVRFSPLRPAADLV